ncbi:MAG: hypothetical protein RIS41_760 [Actinomycetota bacterium]|jgi:hypothetical protein
MTDASTDSRATRWFGRVLGTSILVVIGVIPIVLDRDSYPLSTYPMFSSRRTAVEPVHTAVLVGSDGEVDRLSPTQISGNDEVIIAAQLVYRAIGRDGGATLCDDIARRILDPRHEGATIEIVTEKYDAIAWYEGRRSPISRVVHSSCRVPGVSS